jgi:two-component system phosphate regulon sensor histidine kinase PhoR
VILSLFVAIYFTRSLTNPINKLIAGSKKVAAGNFRTEVILQGEGEFKQLADNFNFMTDRIHTLFTQLARQKDELDTIISSIQEGLVVMHGDGRIIFSNKSFKELVNNEQTDNKYIWEIARNVKINELVEKVQAGKVNVAGELELNNRFLLASVTWLNKRDEMVMILHDITELKKLETIKKDFVVNVSHELRTPLTAIKGFAETLYDTVTGDNKHYIEIINKHTDRLINIVNDLLLLSDLEEKGLQQIHVENISLNVLITSVIKIFEKKVVEKKLYLKFVPTENLPVIKGEYFKLEQVFINLIDNAVKYTDEGGVEIFFNLNKEKNMLKINVQDTGIGIPKQDLQRVFERFYVVDKSRSRTAGGTGLGLSIVKHIVMLHNGKIEVESQVGSGTKFSVLLPV